LKTHADYLFNFAVGQVRDTNVAEDLVAGRRFSRR